MSYRVVYDSLAEEDVKDILDWYSPQSITVAANFLANLKQTETRIIANPFAFLKIGQSKFRRAVIKKFPYCIYFRPEGEVVYIIAIIRFTRSNNYKKKRLRK
jgi:toxin ParE1/3/4